MTWVLTSNLLTASDNRGLLNLCMFLSMCNFYNFFLKSIIYKEDINTINYTIIYTSLFVAQWKKSSEFLFLKSRMDVNKVSKYLMNKNNNFMLQTFQKYKILPSSFYESPILYTSIKRHFKKWNFLSVPIINICIINIWTCIAHPETIANNSTGKLLVKNVELVWHSKPLSEAPHAQTKRQHLCVSVLRHAIQFGVVMLIFELGLQLNFLNVVMGTKAQPTPWLVETDYIFLLQSPSKTKIFFFLSWAFNQRS